MEPKFQSSFIPKSSTQETVVPKEVEVATGPKDGVGLWSFLSNAIFTLAVIACIVVFGAKWYLNKNIASMSDSLTAAKEALEPERINEISRSYDRIISTKGLIDKHVYFSQLLEDIQRLTVKNVRFTELLIDSMPQNGTSFSAKGEALGYIFIAQQADILNKQDFLKDTAFSDLDLNEKGSVLFSFKTTVLPTAFTRAVETPVESTAQDNQQ